MSEQLPRPPDELERLARHYEDTDAADEIAAGRTVTPEPMITTSLRLPRAVVDELRREAAGRGVRYTALLREIAEQHVAQALEDGAGSAALARLEAKVDGLAKEVRAAYSAGSEPRTPGSSG
jgi:uncharacterized protein YceH (UPF0502 family)